MHAGLPFHPYADLFPLMQGAEYESLVEDIRAHGLREPVVTHEGKLLDGRNRQRASLDADAVLRTRAFGSYPSDGDDPLAFVLSSNLHRRHLNESQRSIVAAKMANMKVGDNQHSEGSANRRNLVSHDEAASMLNVGTRTVERASKVLEKAQPEIITAVEQGKIAVSAAASIATKPREEQLGRLAREERKADGTHRQKDDFYRTPAETTWALLAVEEFPQTVWEPACGDGAISKVLRDTGRIVISTDLIERGYGEGGVDFLVEDTPRADHVITNPPFKLDDDFALHALDIGVKKCALLCRLTWLEGSERLERLFSRGKLARVWVFSARQTLWYGDDEFPETDGGMTAYAWFVFEAGHDGPPTLGWLGDQSP